MRRENILLLFITCTLVTSFQIRMAMIHDGHKRTKVIVTGAAGRTGRLVLSKLTQSVRFEGVGLVRSENSAKRLLNDLRCGLDHVVVCDVTKLTPGSIPQGLEGSQALVICTSAVPVVSKLSLLRAFLQAPWNLIRGKRIMNLQCLRFNFKDGQYPERVDFEGQKAQIDMAKHLGVQHVVLVSSMGGTEPKNFLNSIGKKQDGSGNGDILLWKRRAEKYLVQSGMHYTIIHPGGLTNKDDEAHQLILDVNDTLLRNGHQRSISRGDVANLCIAALQVASDKAVSFDCVSRELEEHETAISAEQTLKSFLKEEKTADYSM